MEYVGVWRWGRGEWKSRKWGEGDRAIRYGNGRFQLSASPLPFSSFSHRRAAFPKMNLGKQQKWTHYSIVPVFNVFISSVKKEVQIYPENWLPLLLKHLPKLAAFPHRYQKKIKVYTTGTTRWAIISQRKMAFQISHSRGCFFFFFHQIISSIPWQAPLNFMIELFLPCFFILHVMGTYSRNRKNFK